MLANFINQDSQNIPWRCSTFAEKVWVKDLGNADNYSMQLIKFDPGAIFPPHLHTKAEFIYILEGALIQNNRKLTQGYVSIAEPGTQDSEITTEQGCLFLMVG